MCFAVNNSKQQTQRRAETETIAFIQVFRYNDQSSFHLENDFWDEVDTWKMFKIIIANQSLFSHSFPFLLHGDVTSVFHDSSYWTLSSR